MDSSTGGDRLADYLQGFRIDTHWRSGHPVIWQSGQQDGSESKDLAHSTHCSAFVAAVALGLDLYLLRPKAHVLKLLSNAQVAWLLGSNEFSSAPSAEVSGWGELGTASDAEALQRATAAATRGSLVIAGFLNPDADVPGHLVTLLPGQDAPFDEDGPQVLSVGKFNHASISMREAFSSHHGAWPDAIHLFVHPTELEVGAVRSTGSSAPMP